ncbi:MAG: lytic transglycosylase domain-containing protein [Acidobacteriota bacterium]
MTFARAILPMVTCLLAVAAVHAGGARVEDHGASRQENALDLHQLVRDVSEEHGLDPRLVDALIRVESSYDPGAVSHRGAMGLMQLMPETARRMRIDDPFDPEQNVRAGVREISRLVDRYAGDLPLALAAYNAGEGAVARYGGVPPYEETRSYVVKILTIYNGRPFHLPGTRRGAPVRMVRDANGGAVITNTSPSAVSVKIQRSASTLGPLRGGFGASK